MIAPRRRRRASHLLLEISGQKLKPFLAVEALPQLNGLFALALEGGRPKGELHGVPWTAVNLDAEQWRWTAHC